ncbi:hypothetical protein PYW08_001359 [Mythimna loreyi]|uniref:Uncharacterized protein n=1 Tax=Mythimna loreyi TaxID=667449 RepID=A0ACC2R0P4_9NEOP|nr:hypothetical protein PYW08_001359 [Mythimna loreyi]
MTLQATLGRALRTWLGAARTATSRAQGAPPCRARTPPARRGSRVVCCAPAQGSPPPCPRAPATCPLTCQNATRDQNCVSSSQACLGHVQSPETLPNEYSCDQDPVARRLQVANGVRRAHYERSVARRAAACPAPCPCPAPYALAGQRECARATDGSVYTVLRDAAAGRARCGPGRAPPPPRCLQLAPDDACRIKSNEFLDPCAHRPRVILEIDRSCSSPEPCAPSGGGPPCCRQPTKVEILRAPNLACQNNRHTHTSVALFKAATPVCGGLEDMHNSKKHLKEAGLGRVVTDAAAGPASPSETLGGLVELCVPPGAVRVAVRVSLTGPVPDSPTSSCTIKKKPEKCPCSVDLKADPQARGQGYPGPCSPCGPPTPPRCKPGPVKSPNELKNETKRCSSTTSLLTNTII